MLYRVTLAALVVSASAFGVPGDCKAKCEERLGPCKRQCTEDYPPTLAEWNAMCEAGDGVFGTMPSVEKCKERGALEYSCGSDGPCTQSPTGNCKGRCEDEVARCEEGGGCNTGETGSCNGEDCKTCKRSCEANGGYESRPYGKAPMWEGDVGSCKNQ